LSTVLLIAADNVRALLHQRLLLALMLVTLGLTVVFSVLLTQATEAFQPFFEKAAEAPGEMSDEDRENLEQARKGMDAAGSMFLALFYWFTAQGGTIVALFLCSTAVATEIRRGTIRITLSKPVSRTEFLLGKYCGAVAVLFGYSVLIGVALVFYAYANELDLNLAARYAPWLMFCSNLMAGSVALLLSLFLHPLIAAVVAYFASASFLSSPNPLYFILPSHDRYNVFGLIVGGRLIDPVDILMLSLYAVDVSVIVLLLALWRFRSKELL
jgi:ABC-type transport system involved in multi-copper enzyme maturation permease subunit